MAGGRSPWTGGGERGWGGVGVGAVLAFSVLPSREVGQFQGPLQLVRVRVRVGKNPIEDEGDPREEECLLNICCMRDQAFLSGGTACRTEEVNGLCCHNILFACLYSFDVWGIEWISGERDSFSVLLDRSDPAQLTIHSQRSFLMFSKQCQQKLFLYFICLQGIFF